MKLFATLFASAFLVGHTSAGTTSGVTFAITTKKVDQACGNVVTIEAVPGDDHAAAGDNFKVTLPSGVEHADGAITLGDTGYTFACKTADGDGSASTAATYEAKYTKTDRIVTITKKGADKPCLKDTKFTLVLKKTCILVQTVKQGELKVANSKSTGETGVAGTAADKAFGDADAAPKDLKIASTIKTTGEFSLKFKPSVAAATAQFLTVYVPGYKVATPKCKIGTKDVPTADITASSAAGFGYIQVKGSTDLWATAEIALNCTAGVTAPDATQAAGKVSVIMGATDTPKACGQVTLPKVDTPAPTRAPTKAPTRAFSAAPRSAAATGAAGFVSAVVAYFLF
jgi:hypothetical protein